MVSQNSATGTISSPSTTASMDAMVFRWLFRASPGLQFLMDLMYDAADVIPADYLPT